MKIAAERASIAPRILRARAGVVRDIAAYIFRRIPGVASSIGPHPRFDSGRQKRSWPIFPTSLTARRSLRSIY